MFAALTAELVELQTLGRGLTILGCGVVTVLAVGALKLTDFAGHYFSSLRYLGLWTRELVRTLVRISATTCAATEDFWLFPTQFAPGGDSFLQIFTSRSRSSFRRLPRQHFATQNGSSYFTISEIVPAPTVRPPSRIAKRRPFSIATGVINSICSVTLSPGITISVPSGNVATPVTSVVRK
jgi:hypothetical protein